jgi:hypothetical protein
LTFHSEACTTDESASGGGRIWTSAPIVNIPQVNAKSSTFGHTAVEGDVRDVLVEERLHHDDFVTSIEKGSQEGVNAAVCALSR